MKNYSRGLKALLLLSFVLLISLACQNSVSVTAAPSQEQAPVAAVPEIVLVRAGANASPTPTAFQPLPVTQTVAPTFSPTPAITATPTIPPLATSTPFARVWQGYPDPVIYPPIAIPPPMGIFEQPDQQINILLMGSDQRPFDGSYRTDVLMLLTINAEKNQVTVTSFPRDLYVYLPGWTMERINTAQRYGGFEMTALTFEYNFGVRIDHWALMDFKGFKTLVDSLDGIDVQVEKRVVDRRAANFYYTIEPGLVHMDADTTLWYVRSRKTSSDFDRTQRAQEVLQGIFLRMLALDAIAQAPALYEKFNNLVDTDMTFDELIALVPLAARVVSDGDIRSYAVTRDHVTSWINPYSGAQVLLPNQESIRQLMKDVLSVPE